MGRLRNPHPGEILREEFLKEIGVSQANWLKRLACRRSVVAFVPQARGRCHGIDLDIFPPFEFIAVKFSM